MGYWPSNILIVAGLLFPAFAYWGHAHFPASLLTGFVTTFPLLICALAYHHWQVHLTESDGLAPTNDRIRLGVAIGWTVLAGVFLWLN